jgi:hypothetical protein
MPTPSINRRLLASSSSSSKDCPIVTSSDTESASSDNNNVIGIFPQTWQAILAAVAIFLVLVLCVFMLCVRHKCHCCNCGGSSVAVIRAVIYQRHIHHHEKYYLELEHDFH